MTKKQLDVDFYELRYDPTARAETAQRTRKLRRRDSSHLNPQPFGEPDQDSQSEEGFKTTYQPARYEKGFLLESLHSFYEQALITDVLGKMRGGKEASVYRCQAHPATGFELVAAKVYRPRMFRSLRNDALYREGRETLETEGATIRQNEDRVMRALRNKTSFGRLVAQESWLAHEYLALRILYHAGADVPRPLGANEHAILMSYIGDQYLPAPTLNEVTLEPAQARAVWARVLQNITLFLKQGYIHGDLSAYNILCWHGDITIIDLPQVSSLFRNRSAYTLLHRDLSRTADYFRQYDIEIDVDNLCHTLWMNEVQAEPETVGILNC